MELTEQIKSYLIEHQIDRKSADPYGEAAKHFDISRERVRTIYRRLRKAGLVESNSVNYYHVVGTPLKLGTLTTTSTKREFIDVPTAENSRLNKGINENIYAKTFTSDTLQINKDVESDVKTLDELVTICDIDTKVWDIVRAECKKKDVISHKDKEGVNVFKPLYSLGVFLRKKLVDKDLTLQKEIIKNELFTLSPITSEFKREDKGSDKKFLYELDLFDAHFGQQSWKEEAGEDYDIKIAEERFNKAIIELLNRVNISQIERFLLPIGNDLIAVDSRRNGTYNGTIQDVDSRFYKVIKIVKRVLIENINKLSQIAPVDVLAVAGNHDAESVFFLGEILESYYHNNANVTVDNSASQRKYYQFGKNGFMFTHGDEENHRDLGLIFATEKPDIWQSSSYRTVKVGHFHKSKKTNYVSVDENTGFQVMVLPSLSANSAWTTSKGYASIKAAKAFLYDRNDGCLAELTYNV